MTAIIHSQLISTSNYKTRNAHCMYYVHSIGEETTSISVGTLLWHSLYRCVIRFVVKYPFENSGAKEPWALAFIRFDSSWRDQMPKVVMTCLKERYNNKPLKFLLGLRNKISIIFHGGKFFHHACIKVAYKLPRPGFGREFKGLS